jgi:hypothetical protein
MGTSLDDERAERSRRYPSVTVREAVAFLELVHRGVGLSGGSRETIAQALGHSSLNGTSKRKIAALIQYGLVERDGERYRISDLGRALLIPVNDRERSSAISEAVRRPAIFQEIGTAYDQQPLPSMLANVLAREHGVLPQASAEVAAIFVQSVEQAGLLTEGVLRWSTGPQSNSDLTDSAVRHDQATAAGSSVVPSIITERDTTPRVDGTAQDFSIPLDSKGRKALIHLPTPVVTRDLARISGWIDYMKTVIQEDSVNGDAV